jgi:hypothetical protein
MAVFVELVSDAFEENLSKLSTDKSLAGAAARAGSRIARRPTRGLEIKEDTYAAIKVILADGTELPLVDSSQRGGLTSDGYTNFLLQSVTEARMEKHQIVETFGAAYIFFFGENPRFLDVQAIIINSNDFNWEAEWWENYDQNFRGTKCVEKGGRLYLFYDDNIVEGYMVMSQATKMAEPTPHLIQMSFRLFLTNYRNISFIGSPEYPTHEGAVILDSSDVPNNLLGPSRDDATQAASTDRQSTANAALNAGSLSAAPRLADLIRDASRAGAIQAGQTAGILSALAGSGRSVPFRGLIADNLDEYVGMPPTQTFQGPVSTTGGQLAGVPPAAQSRLETDDLHQTAISQLNTRGADVDNPQALTDMGMMPNFEPNSRTPATFRPQESTAFGFDTSKETTSDNPVDSTAAFRQEPLGAVYGGSVTLGRQSDSRFTEGVGDAKYGYKSDFATRPGFGQSGYGDFGGPGFGSAQGAAGDPGFRDPTKLTLIGASKNQAALAKLRRPKPDQTSFSKGPGLGSSSSGLSGGANVRIGGKVSAFSLISVPGTLKRLL